MAMVAPEKTNKINRGRQKIEIKQLETKSTKHVTFSKRRAGLFKKASELCVLCGAEIAIIAYSPGEKAYSFGHPNVDTVINRYLTGSSLPAYPASNPLPVEEFNKEYTESLKELEEEKKRMVEIEETKKMENNRFLWDEPIDEMELGELEQYLEAMKEMRANLMAKATDQLRMRNSINMLQPSDYGVDYGGLGKYQFGNCLSGNDVGTSGFGLGNYQLCNLSGSDGDDFGTTDFGLGNYQFGNPSRSSGDGVAGDLSTNCYGFGGQ